MNKFKYLLYVLFAVDIEEEVIKRKTKYRKMFHINNGENISNQVEQTIFSCLPGNKIGNTISFFLFQ